MTDARPYDPNRSFRSFWPMFDPLPGRRSGLYLALLRLGDSGTMAVHTAKECCARSSAPIDEITGLLTARGWRPHLVGATATAILQPSAPLLKTVWETLKDGSWVAPQLAAVLALLDSEFEARAREVLVALIDKGATPPSFGPKSATALAAFLKPDVLALEGLDELIAHDVDGSAAIALDCRNRLTDILPV